MKVSKIQYFLAIIFSTLLITNQYKSIFPGVTLAEFLLLISFVLLIIGNPVKIYKTQLKLLLLFFIAILLTLLSFLIQNASIDFILISRIFRSSSVLLSIILIIPNINKSILLRIYKIIVIISLVFVTAQVFLYSFGIQIPIKILPIPYYDEQLISNPYGASLNRFAGFFAEPAHISQFLLPAIIYSILGWSKSNKPNYWLLFFIMFTIFISTSTLGIVASLLLVSIALIVKYKGNIVKLTPILILALFIFSILIINDKDILMYTIKKLDISNINASNSLGVRLFRGWAIFWDLPFIYKIIGIGHGNLSHYVSSNNIVTAYDLPGISYLDYASGMSLFFIYYGVLFALIYIFILGKIFFSGDNKIKLLIVAYIIVALTSGTLLDPLHAFYFLFLLKTYN